MSDEALDNVRVTAQRVQRFDNDVEQSPSDDARQLWRASLEDLSRSIREARLAGFDTADIHEAAGGRLPRRFERTPAPSADPRQPAPQRPAAA
jgi:hypothetical protein